MRKHGDGAKKSKKCGRGKDTRMGGSDSTFRPFGSQGDPQASEHLKEFLKSWRPNERRLLFATRSKRPWDQNTLLKRKFKPLLKALGIRVPRVDGFYILRHGNAT